MFAKDGIIKYQCTWTKTLAVSEEVISDLSPVRDKLYELKLIGIDENNVAYGNLSKRIAENKFVITASGSGKYEQFSAENYSLISDYSIEKNWLKCEGIQAASSESLSHVVIYEKLPKVNYVAHIHSCKLWAKYINKLPTTASAAEYGTPGVAYEIARLLENTSENIFVMAGHQNGLILFSETAKELLEIIVAFVIRLK